MSSLLIIQVFGLLAVLIAFSAFFYFLFKALNEDKKKSAKVSL